MPLPAGVDDTEGTTSILRCLHWWRWEWLKEMMLEKMMVEVGVVEGDDAREDDGGGGCG